MQRAANKTMQRAANKTMQRAANKTMQRAADKRMQRTAAFVFPVILFPCKIAQVTLDARPLRIQGSTFSHRCYWLRVCACACLCKICEISLFCLVFARSMPSFRLVCPQNRVWSVGCDVHTCVF